MDKIQEFTFSKYKDLSIELQQQQENLIRKFERLFEPVIQRVINYSKLESKKIKLDHGFSIIVKSSSVSPRPYVDISGRYLLKNPKYYQILFDQAKKEVDAYCEELDIEAMQKYMVMLQQLEELKKFN